MAPIAMKSPLVSAVGRRVLAGSRLQYSVFSATASAGPQSASAATAGVTASSTRTSTYTTGSSRLYPRAPFTSKMAGTRWQHTVTMDNLNPCIKTMEYAVRGPLVIRATEIEKELESVRI